MSQVIEVRLLHPFRKETFYDCFTSVQKKQSREDEHRTAIELALADWSAGEAVLANAQLLPDFPQGTYYRIEQVYRYMYGCTLVTDEKPAQEGNYDVVAVVFARFPLLSKRRQ